MRTKMMGLCLVAAFLVTAVAVSSASAALPEYKVCAKAAKVGKDFTGKYSDKDCTKATTGGKYELEAGTGKKSAFKAKSGPSKLETPGVGATECKSSKSTGEFAGTKEVKKLVTEFKTCTSLGKKCQSAGAKAGTIITEPSQGTVGYISKSPLKVGVVLSPEGGSYLAQFECEGAQIRSLGSLIGEVKGNINTISKKFTLSFKQHEGKQEFTHFEGGSEGEHEVRTEFNLGEGFFPPGGLASGQEQVSEVTGEALEIAA
jgi:hypothetical protein